MAIDHEFEKPPGSPASHLQHPAHPTEEQQWLASIVASSDDAIIGESLQGIVTSWNKGAERIFGYTADEIVGQPIGLLGWPGNEQDMSLLVAKICRMERVDHYETTRKDKSGRRLLLSLSLSPILNATGEIVGVSKIARDITEQRRTEEALRESSLSLERARVEIAVEKRFHDLIELAPDAIFQVNEEGRILVANRAAETMLGYSREELVGACVDMLVPAAVRGTHGQHRASYLNAPKIRPMGSWLDLLARRKDGIEIPVEISLSPNPTDEGMLVTVVVRDVRERRQAEEKIKVLQKSYLEELETRRQMADRSNHLKSEFLASMSHELRTPLHTIIGFSELLAEELEGPLNEKQKRFLGHIQRDSEHLLELINDVLDLSKIEAGGMLLKTEDVSLSALVTDAVSAIAPRAKNKSVSVEDRSSYRERVCADAVRLKEVLYNLLSNAVKFTPAGGHVWVEAVQDLDGLVRITVADTGMGIVLAEQKNIFEKFYQVGHASSGVREGTGLGLAICQSLIEMHGGRIWVESEPGRGSQFHFTVPAA